MRTKNITRRQFLRITAIGGAAGLAATLGNDLFRPTSPQVISETRILMGTIVSLRVVGDDPEGAQAAANTCLTRMADVEDVLSLHRPNSQLSQLNRNGTLDNADPALLDVIDHAAKISRLSDGAFDITIKPLVDLYLDYQANERGLPPIEAIQAKRVLVNYQHLNVDGNRVSFSIPEMAITLDGIAKGYIVDLGVDVLRKHGFNNVLVEAGGDLLASGQKAIQTPWQIGIQSPRGDHNSLLARFSLQDQAVATSGDYMQPFVPDMTQHHILDPRTGFSSTELASVTVTAPSAMMADGLATAFMVLGKNRSLMLVEQLPDVEAYFVAKNMQRWPSSGLVMS